jgi:AcrR family transcriptional regulator
VAAQELFVRTGYPATTFPAIADAAGVSVQTVFAHFPTKRDLLKEVIDQAIVGDDKPVAVRNRPEVAAIRAEPDPERKLRVHAAQVVAISRRATSADQMLRSAAAVDPEAAELWARGSKARQAGMEEFAAHLFEGGPSKRRPFRSSSRRPPRRADRPRAVPPYGRCKGMGPRTARSVASRNPHRVAAPAGCKGWRRRADLNPWEHSWALAR